MKSYWFRWSVIFQITLLGYYQLIEWVDLFPWNNIRGGNGQESLDFVVGGVLLLLILSTALQSWRMMLAGGGVYLAWIGLEIDTWWIAYVRGASRGWKIVYQHYFADTMKFLPTRGDHLAPDAAHVLMQFLILSSMVTTLVAALQIRSRRNAGGIVQTRTGM